MFIQVEVEEEQFFYFFVKSNFLLKMFTATTTVGHFQN